ncbi:MAG: Hsp20/alpha crystallin family protein [Candidatus Pacebacteria bacterium]|nr:Hsp20/alpha crystallin family protein [Candidatus Paceibacterota bacterium]
MKKPSLLERLTGAGDQDEFDTFYDEPQEPERAESPREERVATRSRPAAKAWQDDAQEGSEELPIDMYQTTAFVVIKALIAGVMPGNVDIVLTRDMVTIKGVREDDREAQEDGYFRRELYWGAFSRTILLPEEVDVDAAEASEKHGVLVIRLPKINKAKETKLKVKSR